MLGEFTSVVPVDALNIALVAALAFFIGLEREEHKQHEAHYAFGGVRTFPLIGLVSYALAQIAAPSLLPWSIGFAVVAGFMLLSYAHKLKGAEQAGLTTEISGLVTYVVGGLVQHQEYWIATTLGVLSVLLLELKQSLEGLTRRFDSGEILTAGKFLVLAAVILPIVPNQELTAFRINPFKTWLVVVAVSGVSFASYELQRVLKGRGGIFLSAVLGGAYSSTVTTVVLARQAKAAKRPHLFSGATLAASGVMYLRLLALLACFNLALARALAPWFVGLGALGVGVGWWVSRIPDEHRERPDKHGPRQNPLELKAAFLFALVFVGVLILTSLARTHFGHAGLYTLAALMGVTDVDPFILGLAHGGAAQTPVALATIAIVIAVSSNNVVKAVYAFALGDPKTGRASLLFLLGLAALGLTPLLMAPVA